MNRSLVVAGAGTVGAFLCFFLNVISANMFWGVLGSCIFIFCAGRLYWAQWRENISIRGGALPLLREPQTTVREEEQIYEGVFREEPPKRPVETATTTLPEAPTFPHCIPDMDDENFILGYALEEIGVGAFAQTRSVPIKENMDDGVMSTAVIGKPKRGKTTLLYFFIAQMILKNSDVMIFDPHATLSKLKTIFPYAHDCKTILSHVSTVHQELDARVKRYDENGGVCLDDPLWLVVDELPLISLYEHMKKKRGEKFESAIDAIQRVILEGRKFRMYCLVSGQSMPATVLPTLARDNIASHYAFFCSDDHARMSGFTKLSIKTLLPRLRMAIGKCILDAATMEKAMIVAIPYTSADHIYTLVRTHSYQGMRQFSPNTDPLTAIIDIPGYGDVEQYIVDRILEVCQEGLVKRGEVCKELGISNRYYTVVKYLCNKHGLLKENVKKKEESLG